MGWSRFVKLVQNVSGSRSAGVSHIVPPLPPSGTRGSGVQTSTPDVPARVVRHEGSETLGSLGTPRRSAERDGNLPPCPLGGCLPGLGAGSHPWGYSDHYGSCPPGRRALIGGWDRGVRHGGGEDVRCPFNPVWGRSRAGAGGRPELGRAGAGAGLLRRPGRRGESRSGGGGRREAGNNGRAGGGSRGGRRGWKQEGRSPIRRPPGLSGPEEESPGPRDPPLLRRRGGTRRDGWPTWGRTAAPRGAIHESRARSAVQRPFRPPRVAPAGRRRTRGAPARLDSRAPRSPRSPRSPGRGPPLFSPAASPPAPSRPGPRPPSPPAQSARTRRSAKSPESRSAFRPPARLLRLVGEGGEGRGRGREGSGVDRKHPAGPKRV